MPNTVCVPTLSGRDHGLAPPAVRAASQPVKRSAQRARRQQPGELGHARLEVVVHLEQIALARLHLALHPRAPRRHGLELRHAHDVVKRHPERQPTRGFVRDLARLTAGRLLRVPYSLKALEVQRAVAGAVVFRDALQALSEALVQRGWKAFGDASVSQIGAWRT